MAFSCSCAHPQVAVHILRCKNPKPSCDKPSILNALVALYSLFSYQIIAIWVFVNRSCPALHHSFFCHKYREQVSCGTLVLDRYHDAVCLNCVSTMQARQCGGLCEQGRLEELCPCLQASLIIELPPCILFHPTRCRCAVLAANHTPSGYKDMRSMHLYVKNT